MENKFVDIVIPVYNEERVLEKNVKILRDFIISKKVPYSYNIIISDNCSTDSTKLISKRLSKKYSNVKYLYIPMKGRGIALKTAWMKSKADVVCFLDADLAADLNVLLKMIKAILGGSSACVGSRFCKGAIVERSLKRAITSIGYNFFLGILFMKKFTDAQSGFKAFNGKIVREILPRIQSEKWFFDTELLLQFERKGYKIKDFPYFYKECPGSSVNVITTSWELFIKAIKLRIKFWIEGLSK